MGAGCEARGDLAQAERIGWGAVKERPFQALPGTKAEFRGPVSLVSLEISHRVDGASGGCLSPGSQLGSA